MAERFASESNPYEVVVKEINKTFDGLNDSLNNKRQAILAEFNRQYESSIANLDSNEQSSLQNKENIFSFCKNILQELEQVISSFGKILSQDSQTEPGLNSDEREHPLRENIDRDQMTAQSVPEIHALNINLLGEAIEIEKFTSETNGVVDIYNIPNSIDVVHHGIQHGVDMSQIILITFYSIIPKAIYDQTEVITLRIGHNFFGEWDKNFILFKSISTGTVEDRAYHLLTGQLAVPIDCFDHSVLRFPYKYCLYMKGKNEVVWEYHHKSASIEYNRFFEFSLESSNHSRGYITNVFDVPIFLPENANTNYTTKRVRKWSYFSSSREEDETFKFISNNRLFLALAMYTPYYCQIGELQMGKCSNINSFINAFITRLNYLVDIRILPTKLNYYQLPVKFENTNEVVTVTSWITYIMNCVSKSSNDHSTEELNNNIVICHIIAILFMKYSLESEDITCQWLDILINCFEHTSIANCYRTEFLSNFEDSFSELKKSYDYMLFDIAYHRFKLIKSLYAIPFYHILFDTKKYFNVCRTNHNYSDPGIIGLPTNCGITIFQHVTIDQFVSLWEQYSAIDPLLVFTFVGSANLTEKFVGDFSTLNNIPLAVYIFVLLFRINSNIPDNPIAYVNAEVRCAIYEEIILKVSLDLTTPTGKVISIPDLLELIAATFILLSKLPLQDTTDMELEMILHLVQQQLLLIEKLDNNYFEHSDTYGEHFLNSEKLFHLVDKVMCFLYPRDIDLQYAKTTTEFQFWNHLIILEFPEAYGWKRIVEAGLVLRLSSLDFDAFQILLLRIIDKDGKYDDKLKCIFSENMNDCIKHYKGKLN